jgi:hypothetical protein
VRNSVKLDVCNGQYSFIYYLGTAEGEVSCTSGLVGSEPLVANLAPEKIKK